MEFFPKQFRKNKGSTNWIREYIVQRTTYSTSSSSSTTTVGISWQGEFLPQNFFGNFVSYYVPNHAPRCCALICSDFSKTRTHTQGKPQMTPFCMIHVEDLVVVDFHCLWCMPRFLPSIIDQLCDDAFICKKGRCHQIWFIFIHWLHWRKMVQLASTITKNRLLYFVQSPQQDDCPSLVLRMLLEKKNSFTKYHQHGKDHLVSRSLRHVSCSLVVYNSSITKFSLYESQIGDNVSITRCNRHFVVGDRTLSS